MLAFGRSVVVGEENLPLVVVAPHQDVRVDIPNSVLFPSNEVVGNQLLDDFRNRGLGDLASFGDVSVCADEHIVALIGVFTDVDENVKLFAVYDAQYGEEVHQVAFPKASGTIDSLGDLVHHNLFAGLDVGQHSFLGADNRLCVLVVREVCHILDFVIYHSYLQTLNFGFTIYITPYSIV